MPTRVPQAPGIPGTFPDVIFVIGYLVNPRGQIFERFFFDIKKYFWRWCQHELLGYEEYLGPPSLSYSWLTTSITTETNFRTINHSWKLKFCLRIRLYLGPRQMSYSWLATSKTPENKLLNDFTSIFKNTPEDDAKTSSSGTRYTWDLFRYHIRDWLPRKPPRTNFWTIFLRFPNMLLKMTPTRAPWASGILEPYPMSYFWPWKIKIEPSPVVILRNINFWFLSLIINTCFNFS